MTRSDSFTKMDQSNDVIKVSKKIFKGRVQPKCDMPFRVGTQVEDEHTQAIPVTTDTIEK